MQTTISVIQYSSQLITYMGHSWLTHKDRKILYVDYSTCKTEEEMINLAREIEPIFLTSTTDIYSIDNVENTTVTRNFMKEIKQLGIRVKDKRKKGAILGINGVKKTLLEAYCLFTKDIIMPFNSKEEALEYLTNDL